jgi:SAM-dependent MidA family methyltransferase
VREFARKRMAPRGFTRRTGRLTIVDKRLKSRELTFRQFVEKALYDPSSGYYAGSRNPIGRGADYVTSAAISPVFAFALARLADEFVERTGDEVITIVDIGCGDGALIRSIASELSAAARARAAFFGVDRSLGRALEAASPGEPVRFVATLDEVPLDRTAMVVSNELYDAFPFARLVQRGAQLNELWVTGGEVPEWSERPAPAEYSRYFEALGIELADGQFADVSLEWRSFHARLASRLARGLVVTFDYGHEAGKLFDARVRRFGTAAAYLGHQYSRDLLRDAGSQDLTAQINFTDLVEAGKSEGLQTLAFERQARFLVSVGILGHPLFAPSGDQEPVSMSDGLEMRERREAARRLVLPDGIGEEIRVLVQGRGVPADGWSFQQERFRGADARATDGVRD